MSRNPSVASRGPALELSSVAADMCARAPAAAALCSLAALAALVPIESVDGFECTRDGLHTDYDQNCQKYVRCSNGAVTGKYSCPDDRVFSEAEGACVPRARRPCVRRECTSTDTLAYASPGTACRQYYRCENGTAIERSCPTGAWFDLERQACTRGAGTCFEPVCAGLPDGEYPDASHGCRRTLRCRGGELRAVASCGPRYAAVCPPPRAAAAPLPAGDADFCSDETCSSLCRDIPNGAYADRTTSCREYFVCEAHRVIRRGVCEPGLLFTNGACEPAAQSLCPPPALSPCFNRHDGLHRDWNDCASWFECRREQVVKRGSCAPGFVFDGNGCTPSDNFLCDGPAVSIQCEGLPSGTYQDLDSNCTRYFHCEGLHRTTLACPPGQVFDGVSCLPASHYLCPSLERESCYGRPDGRYRAADTGCRGYYECVRGEKSIYACPTGLVFDGESCVPAKPGLCKREDHSCDGLSNGYHAEVESGCRRYFYCERGDRLVTLSCLGGKTFDGRACVKESEMSCGGARGLEEGARCSRDGFFVQAGSGCRRYYFCVGGARTALACAAGQRFNGQLCVPRAQYSCPG
ncbi:hypothetical protein HF086_010424 [Spodoptera exigua]|uniref:Chitin-binding type-2 domain-containing protein n=1 Tax=Spodoptera exigua TaxID=7107 RepID=A0A922MU73_SPOEX|nr:hypothetical protein HF086_010424 [Spodoptera exigua]